MTAATLKHKKKRRRRKTKKKNKFCKANDWLNKWGKKWKKVIAKPIEYIKLRYPKWIAYAHKKKKDDQQYPPDTRLLNDLFKKQQAQLFFQHTSMLLRQAGQPHPILMYYFVSFNLYQWQSVFQLIRCSPDFKDTRFARCKHSFILQYQQTFRAFLRFIKLHHEWSSFWCLFELMMNQFVHIPIRFCSRCKDVYKKPQCDFHVYM